MDTLDENYYDSDDDTYRLDLDELGPRFTNACIQTDFIVHSNDVYEYAVMDPDLRPEIPRFVGMPQGRNLFISADVEPQLLYAYLGHEIECNRRRNYAGRCETIERTIFANAPKDPDFRHLLLEARFLTFEALLRYYNIDPDHLEDSTDPFEFEIAQTANFLRELKENEV